MSTGYFFFSTSINIFLSFKVSIVFQNLHNQKIIFIKTKRIVSEVVLQLFYLLNKLIFINNNGSPGLLSLSLHHILFINSLSLILSNASLPIKSTFFITNCKSKTCLILISSGEISCPQ